MSDSSTQSDEEQGKTDIRIKTKVKKMHAGVVHMGPGDIYMKGISTF